MSGILTKIKQDFFTVLWVECFNQEGDGRDM